MRHKITTSTKKTVTLFYLNALRITILSIGLLAFSFGVKAQVSGTVFKDFNANGTKENSATFNEVGMSGVVVIATKPDGSTLAVSYSGGGTATDNSGGYTVSGGTLGQIRLEFVFPDNYTFASSGASGGTTVMFPTAATQNLAVNYPTDYSDANPLLAAPMYINGNRAIADVANRVALVKTPYADNASPTSIGDVAKTGATWGLVYHRSSGKLFSAAFGKRHSDWGPLGPNGLYVTTNAKTATSNSASGSFVNLNTVNSAFNAGTVSRNLGTGNANEANYDEFMFNQVGKVGMGDMDASEDGQYLYVMNLNDRKLWRVEVGPNGTAPTTAAQVAVYTNTPTGPCATGTFRPFAVEVYRGEVYIGGICDGASGNTRNRNALTASIYKVSQSATPGSATFTLVSTIPITYNRNANLNAGEGPDQQASAVYSDLSNPLPTGIPGISNTSWHPWVSNFSELLPAPIDNPDGVAGPQPMLTDIEFDVEGSMILGFADRTGHQGGNFNFGTVINNTALYYTTGVGDIIRLGTNNNGTFTLESGGASNGNTGSTTNGDGPGGGEYYYQDNFDLDNGGTLGVNTDPANHDENSVGGLVLWPGKNEIVNTVFDPRDQYNSGGFRFYANSGANTGKATKATLLYVSGDVSTFGKASGLGDVELLSDNPPIEIGNRVWLDTNGDGIQNAGEAPLVGVTVELRKSDNTLISSAMTNYNRKLLF